jgi:hypothetical protein
MCLAKSVGQGGRNDLTDVLVFQTLFNPPADPSEPARRVPGETFIPDSGCAGRTNVR